MRPFGKRELSQAAYQKTWTYMPEEKQCSLCKLIRGKAHFKRGNTRDGLASLCDECQEAWYIVGRLGLTMKTAPKDLIEAKRINLYIKRFLRK